MPRSRSRKPKQKSMPPQQSRPKKGLLIVIPGKVWAGVLAFCTMLGVLVLWPCMNVVAAGDFSNPASIEFKITNIGFLPLRRPNIGMHICDVTYGLASPPPPPPCDLSNMGIMPEPANGPEQFSMDESYTLRLEDYLRIEKMPISHANFIVKISYYPWYLPKRLQTLFGFESAKGSDGKLYWRSYPVSNWQPPAR